MKPFIPLAIDSIVLLLLFYKDGFGITMKVDMPLNKETKPDLQNYLNDASLCDSVCKS